MATTQKLPSGSWRCRIYVSGKQKSFTGATKKEAEQKAYSYLNDHPVIENGSDLTVRQALTSYIDSKSAILSPATIVGYRNIAKRHLSGIADLKIGSIPLQLIQKEINEEAKEYSPKTVRNIVGLIVPAFSMFGVTLPTITTPQKKKTEIIIPSDEEVRILCDNADKCRIKIPVHLAAYMGLRRSEIAALDFARDYDAKKHTLTIREAIVLGENNERHRKGPKSTSSMRTLPVPSFLIKLIEEAKDAKETMPEPNLIESRFTQLKCSLGLKHIRFHSLRHYYASALVILGVPDFYAVKLMGHGSDSMLKQVYQHVRRDYMDDVSARLDSFFSSKQDTNKTQE